MKRLLFQTGGPWHPVDAQAALVRSWLPGDWKLETAFGNDALDRLDDADLYIAGGMLWPELDKPLPPVAWELAGLAPHRLSRQRPLARLVRAARHPPALTQHPPLVAPRLSRIDEPAAP